MHYDFDREVDRKNTAATKWDALEQRFGDKDLFPMWIADMDFVCPAPVLEAMKARVDHGVFGYNTKPDSYFQAIIDWMQTRHQWSVQKDWICHSPGVVPALSFTVSTFTEPGDKVIIQQPVYPPFASVVKNNGRELVNNPLVLKDGRYCMDFDDLKSKLDSRVKLLILCSPHNPVGRVWTRDELVQLGELCREHNVLVVSDEIHFDAVFDGHTHVPFASISEAFADRSIICTAPSKTFNLAGLQTSVVIIPNEELRAKFKKTLGGYDLDSLNTFGLVALESAYRHGAEWLDQLLVYLQENLRFLQEYLGEHAPQLTVIQPEGTYLVWVDCRALGLDAKELEQFMLKQAKVAVNQGYTFGPGGEGFVRLNIACSRKLLETGLERIVKAVKAAEVGQGSR